MAWNSKTSITNFFFLHFFLQKTQLVSYNSATNPLLQNKSLILQAWTHLLLTMQEYQGESWQKLPVLIWSSRQDIELKMYKYLQINKNKGGVEPWNVHWSSSPHFQSHSCFCPGSGRKPMARGHVWHWERQQQQPASGGLKLLSLSLPHNSLIMPLFFGNSFSTLFTWVKSSMVQ